MEEIIKMIINSVVWIITYAITLKILKPKIYDKKREEEEWKNKL